MKIEEKCGNGRKSHKWWVPHVLKGDNKEYFCLPRFTIHTSIVLQTIWIIVFQGVHVITLIRRNFKSLSPLDFVPSFFSLAGKKILNWYLHLCFVIQLSLPSTASLTL